MSSIVGYIVTDDGDPLLLYKDKDLPRGGILFHSDDVTAFPSREMARQAVIRSARYAESRGYNWGKHYKIFRLRGKP